MLEKESRQLEKIRYFLVAKRPALPLPWDRHNAKQHAQMVARHEAEIQRRRKALSAEHKRNMTLYPARQKAVLDGVKCYACKSVLGLVGKDITNVRQAGRDLLVNTVKVKK